MFCIGQRLQATTKEQQREEIGNLVRLATIKLNGKILGLGVEATLALAVEMAVVTTVAVLVTVVAEAGVRVLGSSLLWL